MTNLSFNQEIAIALYESDDEFPVDLDDGWQWLGYSRKEKALQLLRNNFEEELDFSTKGWKTSSGGRPSQLIVLTIDCFKSLGMMAGTEQGKLIRKYFLECERSAKRQRYRTTANSSQLIPEIQQIGLAVDTVFATTGVDPRLQAGVKANQIARYYPALAPAMEESKQLLSIPVEDKLVRPGKLAELYEDKTGIKLSAQKMNKLLAEKGLQTKNDAGNPSWMPTEEGEQYSKLVLDTAKGHNKSVTSLQWYPSVIEVI